MNLRLQLYEEAVSDLTFIIKKFSENVSSEVLAERARAYVQLQQYEDAIATTLRY